MKTTIKKNKLARMIRGFTPTVLLFASSKAGAATLQMALTLPLAATSFNTSMSSALGIINAITAVLAFGGLTAATIMYMMGRTEFMKQALVGAAVAGLGWVIIQTFFSAGGQNVDQITVTAPN